MGRAVSRLAAFSASALKIFHLTLVFLTGPLAAISVISDVTHLTSILSGPLTYWNDYLSGVSEKLLFLSNLSNIYLNIIYFVLLFTFAFVHYLTRVLVSSRLLIRAAMQGEISPVQPQISSMEPTVQQLVLAGLCGIITAFVAPPLIPFGMLAGSGIGAFFATKESKTFAAEAEEHARRQTERVRNERRALATKSVREFVGTETRDFLLALFLCIAIVAVNFASPIMLRSIMGER